MWLESKLQGDFVVFISKIAKKQKYLLEKSVSISFEFADAASMNPLW